MAELREWDTSAANNNSAPPNGFPENMNYSQVNDAARETMAVMARYERDTRGTLTTGGTANTITVTPVGTYAAYFAGMQIGFTAGLTNTGAVTLNVSALGAMAVVDQDGSALGAGAITQNGIYQVVYDGTNFRLRTTSTPATLQLNGTTAVDLTDADAVLVVAPGTGQHLEFDGNTLQSKSDATTASALELNALGGAVNIGGQGVNGSARLWSGEATYNLEAFTSGIEVRDGNGTTPIIRMDENTGTLSASITSNNAGSLDLNRVAAGEGIKLIGRNAGDTADNTMIFATPTDVRINHENTQVFRTRVDGIVARSGDSGPATLALEGLGGNERGLLEAESTVLTLSAVTNSATMLLQGKNAAGTNTALFTGDPDGASVVGHEGAAALVTTANGVYSNGQSGVPASVELRTNTLLRGEVNVSLTDAMALINQIPDGLVQLIGTTTGNADEITVSGDPNGAASLYFTGTERLKSANNGGAALGSTMEVDNSGAATAARFRVFNNVGGSALRIFTTTANAAITQTDNAGLVEEDWLLMDRNGGVSVSYNGTQQLRTRQHDDAYNTSGAQVRDHDGTLRDVGFNEMAPSSIPGTNFTASELHVSKGLVKNSGGSLTLTLPTGTSGAIPPVGAMFTVMNDDTENITLTAAGTLKWFNGDGAPATGNRTCGYGAIVTVWHFSSSVWHVWGTGIT